jgi:hypothetical protein
LDSNDDFRSELQRAGETFLESLRPELQALRKEIVADIAIELRQSSRKKIRRRPDRRKERIVRLIQENPKITNLEICREMDKLQEKSAAYAPPGSWNCRSWSDAYHQVNNRVHSYIGSVRQSLR